MAYACSTTNSATGIYAVVNAFANVDWADVVNLTRAPHPRCLRILYRAADAVLANSGRGPFGLVGLEAMASGGTVYTGSTGEEYAQHLENAIMLDTANPAEATWCVNYLESQQSKRDRIRGAARETAQRFVWERVLDQLFARRLAHRPLAPAAPTESSAPVALPA